MACEVEWVILTAEVHYPPEVASFLEEKVEGQAKGRHLQVECELVRVGLDLLEVDLEDQVQVVELHRLVAVESRWTPFLLSNTFSVSLKEAVLTD